MCAWGSILSKATQGSLPLPVLLSQHQPLPAETSVLSGGICTAHLFSGTPCPQPVTEIKELSTVKWYGPVSYTHLRAHET